MLRSFSPIGRKAYSALVKSAAATGKDSFSSSWMALSGVSRSISVWSKARPPALHVRRSSLPLSVHLAGSSSHFSSSRGRPPSNPNRLAQSLGALGTGVVVLFGKGKYLIGALKLTKLASLGSMLVTVGTYSVFFGWPYAVGMVGLILVHETGHMMVMLQRGIPFSPAVFVPFMGAAIVMKRRPGDAWEDALVAFGGPVVGSLGAVACTLGGHATDSQLLFALADFGYMINLFNLMPIGSMDGGRIGGALSKYAGVVGLGIGGSMIYAGAITNPIMYLIMLGGTYETFQRFYNPAEFTPPNYYRITPFQRGILTTGYFGLIGALVAAMAYNDHSRKPPEVLEREEREKHWDMR